MLAAQLYTRVHFDSLRDTNSRSYSNTAAMGARSCAEVQEAGNPRKQARELYLGHGFLRLCLHACTSGVMRTESSGETRMLDPGNPALS